MCRCHCHCHCLYYCQLCYFVELWFGAIEIKLTTFWYDILPLFRQSCLKRYYSLFLCINPEKIGNQAKWCASGNSLAYFRLSISLPWQPCTSPPLQRTSHVFYKLIYFPVMNQFWIQRITNWLIFYGCYVAVIIETY